MLRNKCSGLAGKQNLSLGGGQVAAMHRTAKYKHLCTTDGMIHAQVHASLDTEAPMYIETDLEQAFGIQLLSC